MGRTTNYKFYGIVDLPLPNENLAVKYVDKFNGFVNYKSIDTEKLLKEIFNDLENKTPNQIYSQCIILNHIDSVNVMYLPDVAEHIYENKYLIKDTINQGNLNNFDKLSNVYIEKTGETKNYISFFSKFLNRYRPDIFPKYDEIVKEYLFNYFSISPKASPEQKEKFKSIKKGKDYLLYVDAINSFIKNEPYINDIGLKYGLNCYDVVDRFAWQFGKDAEKTINDYKLLIKLSKLSKKNKSEEKKMNLLTKKYDLNKKLDEYINDLTKGE